uniref:poly(A)-specific ribonuclease n=1 Tax=Zea mays TaxID=4577 RepID=A0A804QY24_MAIZE
MAQGHISLSGGPAGGPSALHPPPDPADASPRRGRREEARPAAAGNWNPRLWDWDRRALTARPSADALRLAGGQPHQATEVHRQGAGGSGALKFQLGPRECSATPTDASPTSSPPASGQDLVVRPSKRVRSGSPGSVGGGGAANGGAGYPMFQSELIHVPPPPCSRPRYVMAPPLVFTSIGASMNAAVRDVWASNFDEELSNLSAVLPRYPCVCLDTEFPGAVHDSDMPRYMRGPRESYELVKRNVDDLKLLQVGIALSGPAGRFPIAWQFNIRGFDPALHPHAPASIAMLREQGMDFALLNEFGIDPEDFAAGFRRSGLACGWLSWTAFSGSYDFGYLAKALTGSQPLPDTLDGFLALVATALGVKRAAGRAHCAGSDSLLTTDVLLLMMDRFFRNVDVLAHAGTIVDLT